MSHSHIADIVSKDSAKLIVYNLGYLPGSDKKITTEVTTALQSVEASLLCLCAGGTVSITSYPGHAQGQKEEEALLSFCKTLSSLDFSVSSHRFAQ